MPLPEGISLLALASGGLIGLGVLFHIIGLATPEWSVMTFQGFGQTGSKGLWKQCSRINLVDECHTYSLDSTTFDVYSSSLRACQAFAILGMLASVPGLAMATICVLLPLMGKPKDVMLPMISVAACTASGVSIMIAVSVWGALVHQPMLYSIGYSFVLSVIGGILIGLGGGLIRADQQRVS